MRIVWSIGTTETSIPRVGRHSTVEMINIAGVGEVISYSTSHDNHSVVVNRSSTRLERCSQAILDVGVLLRTKS